MKRKINSSIQDEQQLSLNFHHKSNYKPTCDILSFDKAKTKQIKKETEKSLSRILESAKNLTW